MRLFFSMKGVMRVFSDLQVHFLNVIINIIVFSVKMSYGMFVGMSKNFGVFGYAFLWIWKSLVKTVPDFPISLFFKSTIKKRSERKKFWLNSWGVRIGKCEVLNLPAIGVVERLTLIFCHLSMCDHNIADASFSMW